MTMVAKILTVWWILQFGQNLTEGTPVKKGQLFDQRKQSSRCWHPIIEYRNCKRQRSSFEQAKSEYERKKPLYESKIVLSRFEK